MSNNSLVFVYGTLRSNAVNDASRFVSAEFVQPDSITGEIYDLGWYPGLKLRGDSVVTGDVFSVTPEQLERLDAYEGCPSLYRRRRIETLSGLTVFVYEYNGPVHVNDFVPGGDWLEYKALEKEV